jgi:hypothetical protein
VAYFDCIVFRQRLLVSFVDFLKLVFDHGT